MKDQFGYNYFTNLARDWIKMALEAKQKGYLHFEARFKQFADEATTKAQQCI